MRILPQSFNLENKYIWDLWFLKVNDGWYRYFLQAPRNGDPESRHFLASVGCAFSKDLVEWEYKGTVLEKDEKRWYDTSIWTGSVIENDGKYYFFYTSRNSKKPREQLIGLLVSDYPDFSESINVSRDNPLLKVDPELYEVDSSDSWTHWRDPFVFKENGQFHMLICAKDKNVPDGRNGTVAHAVSSNLTDWNILPPLDVPALFSQCECPYIVKKENLYFLHFCTNGFSDEVSKYLTPVDGDYYFVSEKLEGPYRLPKNGSSLLKDFALEKLAYNTRIVETDTENYAFFWKKTNGDGTSECTHPAPLKIKYSGEDIETVDS